MKHIITALLLAATLQCGAQNPIVQTCFTTDPAPVVSGDRLYVFTGHDEEGADFFWMNDWRLFSTTDMVNWTDHGNPARQCDFAWADDRSWAAQCIERNGKFYLYVPVHSKISHGMAIGVAVADKITGPYHDALGKPLYEDGKWDHIDPTVLIDDDGQAYLYWGNPRLYSVKLNEDMISLASEVKCDTSVTRYVEGPWIIKRPASAKAKKFPYIMMYAAGGIPECIAYSEGQTPQGPWSYVGEVMSQDNMTNSFTNHSGIAEYKGHNYFFYHTGWLPKGGGFARSVSVEEFEWQKDGSLPNIKPTKEGVKPIGTLNPYQKTEAETMAFSQGIHTDWNTKQGVIYVSDIHNGDWQKIREVDFGEGATAITVNAASPLQGGRIEVRLDSLKGTLLATVEITPTGGWEEWETFSSLITKEVRGVHDMYFVFKGLKGCKLFNMDWWQMNNLPIVKELRNPLQWSGKQETVKTLDEWTGRRAEIASLIQKYEIGTIPYVNPKEQVKARMAKGPDGDTIYVDVTNRGRTVTLWSVIHYPKGDGPFPLMIGTSHLSLPYDIIRERPIAWMDYHENQVNGYSQFRGDTDRTHYAFVRLYPELINNGAYSEWIWGFSRIIDGLEQLGSQITKIDTKHIGVSGCSYAGKMALFCGAFDERVALTIAQEPGGGGAAAWRVSHTMEGVEDLDHTDYHWFMESLKTNFGGDKVYMLPYDHHELCAMVCPRALLVLGNPDYKWLADESARQSVEAASAAWKQFGIGNKVASSIVGGHMHCQLPQSQYPIVEQFIDNYMLK